ncbi:hypothetical protein RCC94_15175 [Exiguobacterium acetylicum]|uniref:hypothetical protein n=1 Tax=Exiguobacterium acetylicum TaxID=41170 RepID=UPI0027DF6BE1|nr:hypothetical protein [Exiguobacterium acetylicum]MDQ6468839.1 hypothetical protein [Exiguobacterium acetylicum]
MYVEYSRIIQGLHEDFSSIMNQEYDLDTNYDELTLSANASVRIQTGEIRLLEHRISDDKKLIFPVKVIYESEKYGEFSIVYKSYRGLVAKNAASKYARSEPRWREQYLSHGIFDFYLDAKNRYGELYGGDATHYNVFQDLYKHVTYEQCLSIYRGENIIDRNMNHDQADVLTVLSWLFFEQELNYGSLRFQQYSNFRKEEEFRPRDMIMGFLSMMYTDKKVFDSYSHWNFSKGVKATPLFGAGGYLRLDATYKKFFENLKGNLDSTPSLFCDEVLATTFDTLHTSTGKNPFL